MDQETFDMIMEQKQKFKTNFVEEIEPNQPMFKLKPQQAFRIEKDLNSLSEQNLEQYYQIQNQGVLLKPFRDENQTLFKKAHPKRPKLTFAQHQRQNLIEYYRLLDLVQQDQRHKKQVHLFLTLEQLKRHKLSKYFLSLPDPLYLKIYDYKDVIPNPIDLRDISNKLVRGKYNDARQFEIDIVTMIQNCKIYFIHDMEMFDIAVRFEQYFWNIYEDSKKYQQSQKLFKHWKKKCVPSRAGKNIKPRQNRRKELFKQIKNLPQQSQKKIHALMIRDIFEGKESRNIDKVNIMTMSDKNCQLLQNIVNSQIIKLGPRYEKPAPVVQEKKKNSRQNSKVLDNSKNVSENDIYYSDEEEDEVNYEGSNFKHELGQLLADMDPGQYDSDDD